MDNILGWFFDTLKKLVDLIKFIGEKYTAALTLVRWFHDKLRRFPILIPLEKLLYLMQL